MLWGGLVRPLPINHSLEPKDAIDMNPLAGCKDVKKFRLSFWLLTVCCVVVYGDVIPFNNVASTLLLERDFFKYQPHKKCALDFPDQCPSETNQPNSFCETGHDYEPPLKNGVDGKKIRLLGQGLL
jgi:hypothetical protein